MAEKKQKIEGKKTEEKVAEAVEEKKEAKAEEKKTTEKETAKKEEKKESKPKVKKTEAFASGLNLPISTKQAAAICKFIKGKKIEDAISDLEKVMRAKKAVPMKGEIAHRKGKIMSGRFPKNTSGYFIKLLKNLSGNSNANGLENPVIVDAVANIGQRPYGRFGSVRRKRTHVKITAKEKSQKNKIKKKKK